LRSKIETEQGRIPAMKPDDRV